MITLNSNALCSRANVKDFLQIQTVSNDIDDNINETINRVSTMFETYCGRTFKSASFTEYHDGGSSFIFPKNTPITSITSISEDSSWAWAAASIISSSSYRITDSNSIYYDGIFSSGIQSIKLIYTGGYTTLPQDIVQASITETARIIKHRTDFDVLSVNRDDGTVSFTTYDFLPLSLKTLNSYRSMYVL